MKGFFVFGADNKFHPKILKVLLVKGLKKFTAYYFFNGILFGITRQTVKNENDLIMHCSIRMLLYFFQSH